MFRQTKSSPPFFLRDRRASETRARVKITPCEKRRHASFRCSVAPGNFLIERSKKSRLRGGRSRAQILPAPSPSPSPFNANPTMQPTKSRVPFTFHPDFPENFGKSNNHMLSRKHTSCVTLTSSWKVVIKNSVGIFSVSVRNKWLINLQLSKGFAILFRGSLFLASQH